MTRSPRAEGAAVNPWRATGRWVRDSLATRRVGAVGRPLAALLEEEPLPEPETTLTPSAISPIPEATRIARRISPFRRLVDTPKD